MKRIPTSVLDVALTTLLVAQIKKKQRLAIRSVNGRIVIDEEGGGRDSEYSGIFLEGLSKTLF